MVVLCCVRGSGRLPVDSSEEKYALLRSWYLAHLRKGALLEQQKLQMTPGALIAADKDSVMKLAAEKAQLTSSDRRKQDVSPAWLGYLAAWVMASFSGWLLLFINSGMDMQTSFNRFWVLTFGVFTARSSVLPGSPLLLLLTVAFYGLPLAALVAGLGGKKRQ